MMLGVWSYSEGISHQGIKVYNTTGSYGDSCFACLVYKDKYTPCLYVLLVRQGVHMGINRGLRDQHVQMLHLTTSQPPALH